MQPEPRVQISLSLALQHGLLDFRWWLVVAVALKRKLTGPTTIQWSFQFDAWGSAERARWWVQACANILQHTCVASEGQSGAGMWDSKSRKIHSILTGKVSLQLPMKRGLPAALQAHAVPGQGSASAASRRHFCSCTA